MFCTYICASGVRVVTVNVKLIFILVTVEALHLAQLLAAHGYIFPIDDHILAVKNDTTYYRFQVNDLQSECFCYFPHRYINISFVLNKNV